MIIGMLALQGAFIEHEAVLKRLHVECFEIRKPSDLDRRMDGLIIPGGESTVIGKLLVDMDMMNRIRKMILDGMPVFGTCAGMILLARNIVDGTVGSIGTMPVTVRRNAYGRQLGSFSADGSFGDLGGIQMRFIRAPYVDSVDKGVEILSVHEGKIVAVRYGNQLATAFHPELTDDDRVHRYFLSIVESSTC